jgi:hypothetical protein
MGGPRQRRQHLTALVGALCALSLTCKAQKAGPDQRPALGQVQVRLISSVDVLGQSLALDERALRDKLASQLAHSGVFAEPAATRATVAVTLEAQPFVQGSAEAIELGVKLRLRLAVRPGGKAPARFAEDVAAVGQAPLEERTREAAQAALQRLAERTTSDLVRGYLDRQTLWTGEGTVVAAALASPDTELRIEALRVIGARRMRELAPSVLRLLTDEDEGVRDAALGATVTLGDRSAVKVLASSRHMRDTREMRKVVHAMAALGGDDARDYLAFVADTHDDEEIRSLAQEALDRLVSTAKGGQPTK